MTIAERRAAAASENGSQADLAGAGKGNQRSERPQEEN
jgi:hypothetical protein